MIKLSFKVSVVTVSMSLLFSVAAFSQTVKITPLGSHDGEFCNRDRAMLFEDPDGTRLLFDVGRTIAGSEDQRLGKIDAVLLSGMHGDHIGINVFQKSETVLVQNRRPKSKLYLTQIPQILLLEKRPGPSWGVRCINLCKQR